MTAGERAARNAAIVADYEAGATQAVIAGRYGLSDSAVSVIVRAAGAHRPPAEPVHNYSYYINGGCKCEVCRAANSAYIADRRAWRKAQRVLVDGLWVTTLTTTHNVSTYSNYGCRCRVCTEAAIADRRAYRAQRRKP